MSACRAVIAGAFALMMAGILSIVLGAGQNAAVLLAVMAVLAGLCVLLGRAGAGRWEKGMWLFWPLLFAAQAALSFHAYFMTGWDVKTILESAYAIAGGDTLIDHYYYSLYPNNVFLTLVFATVIRVLRLLLGNPGLDRCAYVLIVLQCALNTTTGLLTWRLARRWTGSAGFAALCALVYTAFVGLSPWVMIPYSDSMALVFPVAVLTLYQRSRDSGKSALCWLGVALLTALGYLIKPQTAIMTIAVLLVEALRLIADRRFAPLAARVLCVTLLTGAAAGPGLDALSARSGINLRPSYALDMGHFAMMGLSSRTDGTYDPEDLARSLSVEDPQERTQMQLEEIRSRLNAMGAGGLLAHLRNKTLINYGDGTFAWGGEGGFFAQEIEDKDDVLSPLLKDLIGWGEARRYPAFRAWMQGIWLALLIGSLGMTAAYAAMRSEGARRDVALCLMLTVIGLTLFELLFEARARYLYAYAPVYVLLGLGGLWHMTAWMRKKGGGRR